VKTLKGSAGGGAEGAGVPAGKESNLLRLAFVEDSEIFLLKTGEGLAFGVLRNSAQLNEAGLRNGSPRLLICGSWIWRRRSLRAASKPG